MYTETAGQLAPAEEQEILREILHEKGIDPDRLRKCEVWIRSHGRRKIEFDADDYCNLASADEGLGEEFDRRRARLPE